MPVAHTHVPKGMTSSLPSTLTSKVPSCTARTLQQQGKHAQQGCVCQKMCF